MATVSSAFCVKDAIRRSMSPRLSIEPVLAVMMLATSIVVPLRSDGLYGTNSLLLSPFASAVCVEAQGKGGGRSLASAHDGKCISSSVRD